jgi:hypothetical protein
VSAFQGLSGDAEGAARDLAQGFIPARPLWAELTATEAAAHFVWADFNAELPLSNEQSKVWMQWFQVFPGRPIVVERSLQRQTDLPDADLTPALLETSDGRLVGDADVSE